MALYCVSVARVEGWFWRVRGSLLPPSALREKCWGPRACQEAATGPCDGKERSGRGREPAQKGLSLEHPALVYNWHLTTSESILDAFK